MKSVGNLWHVNHRVINGFNQFCRDWQPRNERYLPVLALHGSLTQSGAWSALSEFAGSIRMLCPDQRGFGRSEDPGGDSCAEFASDALTLAQNMMLDRYVIMGHSFACSIALEAARLAAGVVAAVVLVDPVVRVGMQSAAPPAPSPEVFATLEEAESYFRDTEEGMWTDDSLRRFVQDIMIHDDGSGSRRFPYALERLRRLRAFIASPASDYHLFPKARTVLCPVLVFRGGMSKRFPPVAEQSLREAFASRAKVVVCPHSGHFPTATEPSIIVEELKNFLDRV